ncbi:hypothetical protein ACFLW1_02135 [Chloroflexota bacterium]
MGIAALVLGLVGIFAWLFPPIGFPVSTAGLVLGIIAWVRSPEQKGRAISGTILCLITLILNIAVVVGILAASFMYEEMLPGYYQ